MSHIPRWQRPATPPTHPIPLDIPAEEINHTASVVSGRVLRGLGSVVDMKLPTRRRSTYGTLSVLQSYLKSLNPKFYTNLITITSTSTYIGNKPKVDDGSARTSVEPQIPSSSTGNTHQLPHYTRFHYGNEENDSSDDAEDDSRPFRAPPLTFPPSPVPSHLSSDDASPRPAVLASPSLDQAPQAASSS